MTHTIRTKPHGQSRITVPAFLLLFTAMMQGCAGGLELAAVGAAANAAQAGSTVYKQGKINAAHLAPLDGVVLAGEEAIADLGLVLKKRDDRRLNRVELFANDETGAKYKIRVFRRTDRLTRYQIDVGWFGHEALARLLLRRMQVHLADYTFDDIKHAPLDDTFGAGG